MASQAWRARSEQRIADAVVLLVGVAREVVEVLLLGGLVTDELVGPLYRREVDAVVRLDERDRRALTVVGEERRAREVRPRPELEEIQDRGCDVELRRGASVTRAAGRAPSSAARSPYGMPPRTSRAR